MPERGSNRGPTIVQSVEGAITTGKVVLFNTFKDSLTHWVSVLMILGGSAMAAPLIAATVSSAPVTALHSGEQASRHLMVHARNEVAPSLSGLQRDSLPKGFFYAWCGEDSFFIQDGKQLLLFGSDLKRGVVVPIVPDRIQCNRSASRVAWQENKSNSIKVLNLGDGSVSTLAKMRKVSPLAIYSLSPNLGALAYDPKTVEFETPETGGVKLIPIAAGNRANAAAFFWSSDSSRLFHVLRRNRGAVSENGSEEVETLEVINVDGDRATAKLPRGYSFANDGTFIRESNDLLLYMRPVQNESASGIVFRCTGKPVRCKPAVSGVDQLSLSEQGTIGLVKEPSRSDGPHRGSKQRARAKYVLEIRNVGASVQYAQQYTDDQEVSGLAVKVSPSGQRIIVIRNSRDRLCDRGVGAAYCQIGEVLGIERR